MSVLVTVHGAEDPPGGVLLIQVGEGGPVALDGPVVEVLRTAVIQAAIAAEEEQTLRRSSQVDEMLRDRDG